MSWDPFFASHVSVIPNTDSTCHTNVVLWAPYLHYVASVLLCVIGHFNLIDIDW